MSTCALSSRTDVKATPTDGVFRGAPLPYSLCTSTRARVTPTCEQVLVAVVAGDFCVCGEAVWDFCAYVLDIIWKNNFFGFIDFF
jgi:hypothetical protein